MGAELQGAEGALALFPAPSAAPKGPLGVAVLAPAVVAMLPKTKPVVGRLALVLAAEGLEVVASVEAALEDAALPGIVIVPLAVASPPLPLVHPDLPPPLLSLLLPSRLLLANLEPQPLGKLQPHQGLSPAEALTPKVAAGERRSLLGFGGFPALWCRW